MDDALKTSLTLGLQCMSKCCARKTPSYTLYRDYTTPITTTVHDKYTKNSKDVGFTKNSFSFFTEKPLKPFSECINPAETAVNPLDEIKSGGTGDPIHVQRSSVTKSTISAEDTASSFPCGSHAL